MFSQVQTKLSRKRNQILSVLNHRYEYLKYRWLDEKSILDENAQAISDQLKCNAIAITSLEELEVSKTNVLKEASDKFYSELQMLDVQKDFSNKTRHAFSHSTHISPLRIARADMFLWGLEDRIVDILESYTESRIAYHGMHIRKEIPNNRQIGTRYWHVDDEDRYVIKIIIYWNDVDDNGGPFEYIPLESTPSRSLFKSSNYVIKNEDMEKVIPREHWKRCTGSKGTLVFVDTGRIFHHATLPQKERTAIFLKYTTQMPIRPELCRTEALKDSFIMLKSSLSEKQRRCVWNSHFS